MTTATKIETIRERVIEAVNEHVGRASINQHLNNIHTLYAMPDGSIYWGEEATTNTWDVLRGTNKPVAAIYQAGTGSTDCDCDACRAGDDPEDWAAGADGVDCLRDEIEQNVKSIDQGYFDGED